MNNIIKTFLVVVAMTVTTGLLAQNFGVRAGLNLSSVNINLQEELFTTKETSGRTGFHVGAIVDFPIAGILSLETGLFLSQKGYTYSEKTEVLGISLESTLDYNLFYLEIPVLPKVTFDLGGAKLFGILGPYAGFGVAGNIEYEFKSASSTTVDESDISWGSEEGRDDFRPFDYGLVAGAGLELSAIQIMVTYSVGLADISTGSSGDSPIYNRVLGVSVGYNFSEF